MSNIKEIMQKIVSIVIIILMTFVDFAVIGINAVSYAIDMKVTNSDNVTFCAYFVSDDIQTNTMETNINSNDLKVYIEIAVSNEGYLNNGQISLENTSFKFKENQPDVTKNEYVKELNEKTILLDKINAGDSVKIEAEIEFINGDYINAQSLNKDNKIVLTGLYKNSKKDIDIHGETTVRINWKSQEELRAKIGAKILTNKVYDFNGSKKRIVQVLVDSKLENDLYPIKNTKVQLSVPQGVENTKVHSRTTEATSDNLVFSENNYKYNSETGILEIDIQNQEKDGNISWIKGRKDSLVVTYIYSEDIEIKQKDIDVNNIITLYDDKQVNADCKVTLNEDINGILTSNINLDEEQIYKGKLYTGEKRYYTTSTVIDVNYALMEKIQIQEKQAEFCANDELIDAKIEYVQSKISKAEFETVFGKDGYIRILDTKENVIANINNQSEVDDNGYININYDSGIESIVIITSKPLSEKRVNIYHRKVILNNKYSREKIEKFTGIKEEFHNLYDSTITKKIIELKETESKASIEINKDTLSVLNENKNVQITATLETNDESKDLYKDPVVDIIFPKEIKEVKISSAKALYRNGLKISNCEKTTNKNGNTVLHIEFEGEQTKYSTESVNGLEIYIYAELIFDKLTTNGNTEFVMNYTNGYRGEKVYKTSKKVNVESNRGVMIYNNISDYNDKGESVEVIDEEQTTIKLEMNSTRKIIKVDTAIINNYKDLLAKEIVIIGKIPVISKGNTFDSQMSNIIVSNENAKIYYNKNVDIESNDKNWTKENKEAKSYMIVLNSLNYGEIIKISYKISIPEKLSYNEKGILSTELKYKNNEKEFRNSSNIVFETENVILKPKSEGNTQNTNSGLEINISAVSGNKELNEQSSVFDGETIRYKVSIKNNTGKDCNDLVVKATQKNGKLLDLVEKEVFNPIIYDGDGMGKEHYWEVIDTNIKEYKEITIKNGESISLEYQMVADKTEGEETYSDISITSANNNITETITTQKYTINDAELSLLLTPGVSEECEWKSETTQQVNLDVTNMAENELTNVGVKVTLGKGLTCDKNNDYIKYESDTDTSVKVVNKEENSLGQTVISLEISKIEAGKTVNIYVIPYILDLQNKTSNLEFFAEAAVNGKVYSSNNLIRKVSRLRKDISLTQLAKVNGQDVKQDTILNDGDKVDFYITVKNEDTEKANISIFDYIQLGIQVEKIILVYGNQQMDITNKYENNVIQHYMVLEPGKQVEIIIYTVLDVDNLNGQSSIINKVNVDDMDSAVFYTASVEFKVNVKPIDTGDLNITVNQTSNKPDGSTIKNGEEIEYIINISNIGSFDRKIDIYDYINTAIKDVTILVDDKKIAKEYIKENDLIIEQYTMKAKSDLKINIKGTANLIGYNQESIFNEAIIKSPLGDIKSNSITYKVIKNEDKDEQDKDEQDKDEQDRDEQDKDEQDKDEQVELKEYNISGMAWIDSNKNGKRDNNEESISDLTVKAINTKTNDVISSTETSEDGKYSLKLKQGKYIIVFKYDNENYYVTTYQAKKVGNKVNSDAISKKMEIDDRLITVGATDVINLTSNKQNIDIGLISRKKFDIELKKYVTKIVVTNKQGTKTYTFDNSELAKVEIPSKYLKDSTVLVEYTVKVTNIGDIDGYVENIVDKMPSSMKFSSDINQDWYKSGKYLHNESISEKVLAPGESEEVKLTLTKNMTESNTGLVNNTAEIKASYNKKNIKDEDEENDTSMADVIISVKTGETIRFILLIVSLIVIIVITVYYIIKRYINVRI